ncbi:methylenetetrahydrofolate reductase C-terminal domain-containing protein [Halarsenatibacter silvermanii]|uniref:Methylene-tetrahydrofolate reductase C terminal n=1 Tax=Halarsenatibacter silvermanii TaxID=321763 RepID=A0A1G9I4K9_9FIRM|nr:methylenetetrahydrofolate reductase C-terminal domain-containing protein [Halarsenatibacter silvermanii]SDL19996.1 Methylene-tetrahydrofolate reductase C terminal [Halarsenatibacter silvermanii]
MIVGERKEVDEIRDMLPEDIEELLIVGCGTCVTVSLAGGEREAKSLRDLLELYFSQNGESLDIAADAIKRQCDDEFIDEIEEQIEKSDAVLSLACGIGVQHLAIRFPEKLILPGLNTTFYGRTSATGEWEEMCHGCGECVLDRFAGICPIARCSKSLLNGPCGGSEDGNCEVDDEIDCGWELIYERAKELEVFDRLLEHEEPKDWTTYRDGGVRSHKNPEFFRSGGE